MGSDTRVARLTGLRVGAVERLRRHTYSALATLALLTIFAVAFQVGDRLLRLLLVFAFLGLLVWSFSRSTHQVLS